MPARYILRLDDIAPNMAWERYRSLEEVLLETGIRPLLGVIPDNRDPDLLQQPTDPGDFWAEMRRAQERGWTISMHGYRHLYVTDNGGLLGLSQQSEFAGLPRKEQETKLRAGKEILADHGLETVVFMAPSHSFDRLTEDALRATGFTTITDGFALYPYRRRGLTYVPQLFATPRALPFGIYTFCQHLNTQSDAEHQALLAFLRRHAQDFISFDEARRSPSRLGLSRLAGWGMRKGLGLARGARPN